MGHPGLRLPSAPDGVRDVGYTVEVEIRYKDWNRARVEALGPYDGDAVTVGGIDGVRQKGLRTALRRVNLNWQKVRVGRDLRGGTLLAEGSGELAVGSIGF